MLVPPLISKGAIKSKRPTIVLRLPTQAGKVSKMVTTNLVAKGPSWIAKGDNYYSLCVPNRRMVACAPIVATSVMQDIEVGAMAGPKGEPLLTFKIAPGTKQAPKRIVYAINYFLTRTNKQVAHLNRKAVSYAPAPRQTSLRVGPTSNSIDDTGGSGGSCTYDDEGGMDCSGGGAGGGGGNEGGGYEGGEGGEGDYDYNYDPFPTQHLPPTSPLVNARVTATTHPATTTATPIPASTRTAAASAIRHPRYPQFPSMVSSLVPKSRCPCRLAGQPARLASNAVGCLR